MAHQNSQDVAKVVFRGKFMSLNIYLRGEMAEISYLRFYIKKWKRISKLKEDNNKTEINDIINK